MKKYSHRLIFLSLFFFAGCVATPTRNFSISIPQSAEKANIIEIVIDVAKEMNLPPVGKLDKENGVVEFGDFGMPEIGVAAQVRIRADKTLDVTVKRTSVYTPLPIEKTANEFKNRIQERLAQIK